MREPLLHFLVLALAVFAFHRLVASPAEDVGGRIVVSAHKIEQMEAIFTRTRMRPPTAEELKLLIDDHVAEELFVREAVTLGLDQDDTVIRRRLRQKMEFLIAAEVEAQAPTDTELQAYLDAHPDAFDTGAMVGFEQVFLSPQAHGDRIEADAQVMLAALQADPAADPAGFGDPTLLPALLPPSDAAGIDGTFGPGFAAAMAGAEPGAWVGPLTSAYGKHLVRVTERQDARRPRLDEIHAIVAREWTNERTRNALQEHLGDLLARHDVVIDLPQPAAPP
ncbi:peptidyl-prolyl cis-trans isomerase [Rhodobacter sp. CZR27]|uniref:peptidylprolyl isomerase n=1 Tax=Rhodobacter sp. CZR27 TaxID=2033869 RepID=UPI0012FDBD02|nr:peptidylprolyl isomerase [Rhodobacter sp. CZR27]